MGSVCSCRGSSRRRRGRERGAHPLSLRVLPSFQLRRLGRHFGRHDTLRSRLQGPARSLNKKMDTLSSPPHACSTNHFLQISIPPQPVLPYSSLWPQMGKVVKPVRSSVSYSAFCRFCQYLPCPCSRMTSFLTRSTDSRQSLARIWCDWTASRCHWVTYRTGVTSAPPYRLRDFGARPLESLFCFQLGRNTVRASRRSLTHSDAV